jgi:hypothetical protein
MNVRLTSASLNFAIFAFITALCCVSHRHSCLVSGSYVISSIPYSPLPASAFTASAALQPLTLGDDALVTLPLAFSFPFLGSTYTSLVLCSNGWLSFNLSTTSATYITRALPAPTPDPHLALFWWFTDLTPALCASCMGYATVCSAVQCGAA